MVYPFKGHRGPVNCVAFNDIIMKSWESEKKYVENN